jgi:hypothetical protein
MKSMRVALALGAMAALLAGCRTEHLALRTGDRLSIQRPDDMERVALPVTVRWKAGGVKSSKDLRGPGPFFAVFVDRPPVAAGTGLRTLVDSDCRTTKGCPDLSWFADRNVYVTGEPSVTIRSLSPVGGSRVGADNAHRLTVVLIGEDGVRVDESAASVEFEVAGA